MLSAPRPRPADGRGPGGTLLICGAFDMQNFGDLLFPEIARARLPDWETVIAVAPTGCAPGLGCAPPMPAQALFNPATPMDAVMIGGGYIVHDFEMDGLVKLRGSPSDRPAGARLSQCWEGATRAAALRRVPVVWNAPGVPFPFASPRRPALRAICEAADYFSLRDRASARLFLPEAPEAVTVTPDPVAELARHWPKRSLEPHWRRVRDRVGLGGGQDVLAVHVRDRSLNGLGPAGLAGLIDRFAAEAGLVPLLVAVGEAHDDAATARLVSACLTERHVVLEAPESLREIAAVFAHARLYVGASLHGYIAAAAYGVPGALVARPAYGKFAGFVEHAGWPDDLHRDWAGAFDHALALLQAAPVRPLPPTVFAALDAHWTSIRAALARTGALAAERSGFLEPSSISPPPATAKMSL
ncbi:MAG: polysaccharide pyruvyl transferase family protein [Oceanicaulis sp.]